MSVKVYNKNIVKPNKVEFLLLQNFWVYTTLHVNLSGANIQPNLLLPVLDNTTYNIACEKTGEAKCNQMYFIVWPWALFIVITKHLT